jgi:hypothetical protein
MECINYISTRTKEICLSKPAPPRVHCPTPPPCVNIKEGSRRGPLLPPPHPRATVYLFYLLHAQEPPWTSSHVPHPALDALDSAATSLAPVPSARDALYLGAAQTAECRPRLAQQRGMEATSPPGTEEYLE